MERIKISNYEIQAKKFAELLIEMCFENDYEDVEDEEDWYRLKACNYDGWQEVFCRWLYRFDYINYDEDKKVYCLKGEENE